MPTEVNEAKSSLLETCPSCKGIGYDPDSHPPSLSFAVAVQYGAIKFCPACQGRKVIPSADGLALVEFLKLPSVARELAPVFAQYVPDNSPFQGR